MATGGKKYRFVIPQLWPAIHRIHSLTKPFNNHCNAGFHYW